MTFDYRGPDVGVDWVDKNGHPCTCQWNSSMHGDTCPEHKKKGVPLATPALPVMTVKEIEDAAANAIDTAEAKSRRLREALTWAVGFIQCNLPSTSAAYPDMRNAQALVDEAPLYTGEFQLTAARAEVAEHERDELRKEVDTLRQERWGTVGELTKLRESRENLLRQQVAIQKQKLAGDTEIERLASLHKSADEAFSEFERIARWEGRQGFVFGLMAGAAIALVARMMLA